MSRRQKTIIISLSNDGQYCHTTHLEETDGSSLLTEALTAEVESVLADDTSLVGTDTAVDSFNKSEVDNDEHGEVHTIDGCPCRTCGDERTKQSRGSFWCLKTETTTTR